MGTADVLAAQAAASASTIRILLGQWCEYCGHTRDEHSQILAGAPCLDCECFGWTHATGAEPVRLFDGIPQPRKRRWWQRRWAQLPAYRIHSRRTPGTAELWRDGQEVA